MVFLYLIINLFYDNPNSLIRFRYNGEIKHIYDKTLLTNNHFSKNFEAIFSLSIIIVFIESFNFHFNAYLHFVILNQLVLL